MSESFCSRCGAPVTVDRANFCKQCGTVLGSPHWLRRDINWNPWIAIALSVIPGLGQIYKGHLLQGLGWLTIVAVGYTAQPLGMMLHILCAANAALAGAIEHHAAVRDA